MHEFCSFLWLAVHQKMVTSCAANEVPSEFHIGFLAAAAAAGVTSSLQGCFGSILGCC